MVVEQEESRREAQGSTQVTTWDGRVVAVHKRLGARAALTALPQTQVQRELNMREEQVETFKVAVVAVGLAVVAVGMLEQGREVAVVAVLRTPQISPAWQPR